MDVENPDAIAHQPVSGCIEQAIDRTKSDQYKANRHEPKRQRPGKRQKAGGICVCVHEKTVIASGYCATSKIGFFDGRTVTGRQGVFWMKRPDSLKYPAYSSYAWFSGPITRLPYYPRPRMQAVCAKHFLPRLLSAVPRFLRPAGSLPRHCPRQDIPEQR